MSRKVNDLFGSVQTIGTRQGKPLIVKQASTAVPILVQRHKERGTEIESVQEYQPPFDKVFVRLVERAGR